MSFAGNTLHSLIFSSVANLFPCLSSGSSVPLTESESLGNVSSLILVTNALVNDKLMECCFSTSGECSFDNRMQIRVEVLLYFVVRVRLSSMFFFLVLQDN